MGKKERERKEGDNSQKRGWYYQMHERDCMVPGGNYKHLRERMMEYKNGEISRGKVKKDVVCSENQLFLLACSTEQWVP